MQHGPFLTRLVFADEKACRDTYATLLVTVIVNSKLLKRHSKDKRRAPAYSRALSQIIEQMAFPKNSSWEAQVRLPEGERMRQIRWVFQRIVRGMLRSGCQRVRGGRLGVKAGVV